MLKNYIKIAYRNLLRYKVYSIINIFGLALGITCTILLALFVQHELSYDNYFPESERMYRIAAEIKISDQEYNVAAVPAILAQVAKDEISEIEKTARFRVYSSKIVKYDNNSFSEGKICYADNSVIDLFAINVFNGNAVNALEEPNSIIISEKAAKKYFASKNPLGEVLRVDNEKDYKVTGVFKEIPQNTHFDFDFMMSMSSLDESRQQSWFALNFQTYITLKKGSNFNKVVEKINVLLKKHCASVLKQTMGITLTQLEEQGGVLEYLLQPVQEIHLHSDLQTELGVNSDIKYVYIFSIIAAFILIIACVNFMNISTARSATRAKEVGIRKVLGSDRNGLVKQFLTESFITTIISLFLAIGLMELVIPHFNNLIGKELAIEYFNNPFVLFSMITVLTVIGLLAGSYPAFVLSSYKPTAVLRGKLKSGSLRSGLVVFQFSASIIMIISTIVVLNQLNYIQNKKLGFSKENVITLDNTHLLRSQVHTFKEKMQQNSEIINATVSGFLPVPSSRNHNLFWVGSKREEGVSIHTWEVDHDYISTMGMKIVEGRDFSRDFSTDSSGVILNEAAIKLFGIKYPIRQKMTCLADLQGGITTCTIVGVVKNFHFQSLRNNISPLAMFLGENKGAISFRTNSADVSLVITKLKETWKEMAPGQPFHYSFLDERFTNMYEGEQRISQIFGTFAGLAIFISCLGLFSLSAFTTEQKTKEIGIRKVLGASSTLIVTMLSKEFVKLVVIAFIIASPIAYYFMNQWLTEFEYRTDLSIWIFVTAGFISLGIAVIAVSYHALKAASANPVDSLRSE